LALAAALAVLLSLSASPAGAAAVLDTKALRYGHEEGLAKAKAEGKHVLAYFWTTWCGNCAWLNENVLANPAVVETLDRDFVFVPLDADLERDLGRQYLVRVVPMIVFLDPDGEPATVLPGLAPPEIFVDVLNYVSSKAYLEMEFDQYAALGDGAPKAQWQGAGQSTPLPEPKAPSPALIMLRQGGPALVGLAGDMLVQTFSPALIHSTLAVVLKAAAMARQGTGRYGDERNEELTPTLAPSTAPPLTPDPNF
jgi:thioredoxin-related protein